ncbi:MAG: DNA-processing protein DprA [Desulfotomaculum sp.]|nr:DNA-processing protein DprA [Desulfotomaculum sp.]MCL0080884.1 DNA-processing protein DprA [Peptococcaceae bacterium]
MDSRIYWLGWQLLLPGAGKRVWKIIDHFGGPELAWQASETELLQVPKITSVMVEGLMWQRQKINLEKEVARLQKQQVDFITYADQDYPPPLKQIFDPPLVLFVRGSLKQLDYNHTVAMVGSRKPTDYGRTVARRLASELAEHGVSVVSGMARGIDTIAHRGVLSSHKGFTVAVLGCGADVVYPPENSKLLAEIVQKGAVITEFPLGSPPEAWHFPARNRIISGLSQLTIVVEAGPKSGALITADFALEQDRDVMVVPGDIYSDMSKGPLKLLKQGAKPVTGVADVLEELGLEEQRVKTLFDDQEVIASPKPKLSITEQTVWEELAVNPQHLEALLLKINSPSQEVIAALMFLEIKGLIKKMPGRMYAAVKSKR